MVALVNPLLRDTWASCPMAALDAQKDTPLSRRQFMQLGSGVVAGTALALSQPVNALELITTVPEKKISLYNIHTQEKITTTFWADGQYIEDGIRAINRLLRDHRSGDLAQIDMRLIDLLVRIQQKTENNKTFEVISGYRSPKTNSKIRHAYGKGVATHSLHMEGQAIDIRLPGTSLEYVKKAALHLRSGGVGFYPRDNFVHVDVGRVRFWQGKKA